MSLDSPHIECISSNLGGGLSNLGSKSDFSTFGKARRMKACFQPQKMGGFGEIVIASCEQLSLPAVATMYDVVSRSFSQLHAPHATLGCLHWGNH